MKSRTKLIVLSLSLAFVLAGCSASALRDSATRVEDGAERVREVATQVEQGKATHADLIDAIRSYVPASLQDEVDEAFEVADNAPDAAREIADIMDDLAVQWRLQAEKGESDASNAINGGLSILAAILGGGTTAGIAGTILGLFRGRKQGAEFVTLGVQRAADTDPAFRDAIRMGTAGETLGRHFAGAPASIQKAVAKNKV